MKVDNRIDTGGLHIPKFFGCKSKVNCYRCFSRKVEQQKRDAETTNEARTFHPRENPDTGTSKLETEENPGGRKCITVHIPDRSFSDIVNQT